jgi:hypothetical protein
LGRWDQPGNRDQANKLANGWFHRMTTPFREKEGPPGEPITTAQEYLAIGYIDLWPPGPPLLLLEPAMFAHITHLENAVSSLQL